MNVGVNDLVLVAVIVKVGVNVGELICCVDVKVGVNDLVKVGEAVRVAVKVGVLLGVYVGVNVGVPAAGISP